MNNQDNKESALETKLHAVLQSMTEIKKKNKKSLNEYMTSIIYWIGLIASIITSIAYVVVTFILVFGIEVDLTIRTTRYIFVGVGALVGMMILFGLKVQGISIASKLEENKTVIEEYRRLMIRTKYRNTKKPRDIKYFYIWSTVGDFITKVLTTALSMFMMVYFVVSGSQDYALFGLMITNLLMFLSFGLLAMNKSYNFYNEQHIQFIKMKIFEAQEIEAQEKENKEVVSNGSEESVRDIQGSEQETTTTDIQFEYDDTRDEQDVSATTTSDNDTSTTSETTRIRIDD